MSSVERRCEALPPEALSDRPGALYFLFMGKRATRKFITRIVHRRLQSKENNPITAVLNSAILTLALTKHGRICDSVNIISEQYRYQQGTRMILVRFSY